MTTSTNRISKASADVDVDVEHHWSAGKMKQRHREAGESPPVSLNDTLLHLVLFTSPNVFQELGFYDCITLLLYYVIIRDH